MHSITFNLKLVVYCRAEFTIDHFAKKTVITLFLITDGQIVYKHKCSGGKTDYNLIWKERYFHVC